MRHDWEQALRELLTSCHNLGEVAKCSSLCVCWSTKRSSIENRAAED
jgi:hypothetical protein